MIGVFVSIVKDVTNFHFFGCYALQNPSLIILTLIISALIIGWNIKAERHVKKNWGKLFNILAGSLLFILILCNLYYGNQLASELPGLCLRP